MQHVLRVAHVVLVIVANILICHIGITAGQDTTSTRLTIHRNRQVHIKRAITTTTVASTIFVTTTISGYLAPISTNLLHLGVVGDRNAAAQFTLTDNLLVVNGFTFGALFETQYNVGPMAAQSGTVGPAGITSTSFLVDFVGNINYQTAMGKMVQLCMYGNRPEVFATRSDMGGAFSSEACTVVYMTASILLKPTSTTTTTTSTTTCTFTPSPSYSANAFEDGSQPNGTPILTNFNITMFSLYDNTNRGNIYISGDGKEIWADSTFYRSSQNTQDLDRYRLHGTSLDSDGTLRVSTTDQNDGGGTYGGYIEIGQDIDPGTPGAPGGSVPSDGSSVIAFDVNRDGKVNYAYFGWHNLTYSGPTDAKSGAGGYTGELRLQNSTTCTDRVFCLANTSDGGGTTAAGYKLRVYNDMQKAKSSAFACTPVRLVITK